MAGGPAAAVVPRLFHSADGPVLMDAALAVERRGGSVRRISWTVPQSGGDDARARVAAHVSEAVDAVAAATGVAAPVVIGKSLGSLAATVAAGRSLTPILTDEPTVAALRRAAAPCLLIGGTADKAWDGPARQVHSRRASCRSTGRSRHVRPRAHGSQSAAVIGQVTTTVENILDHQVWPQSDDQNNG